MSVEEKELSCEASLDRGDALGEQGLYSQVFLSGKESESVLKIVKLENKTARKDFFNEVDLTVRACKNEYGPMEVRHGECKKEKYGFVIMKRGIPLKKWRSSEIQADTMCRRILKSLSLMHKDGVFHQDTHIGNFIYYPDIGEVRIIDYGFAIQCGQDLTGTVAAAYDIAKAILQLIGLETKTGGESMTTKQYSRLVRYLDEYWNQESFEFIWNNVFKFISVKGDVTTTKFKPTKIQPYVNKLYSYWRNGVIAFIHKLFEQVPAVKPSGKDLDWFLNNRLMAALYVEGFITTDDLYGDSVMTECRHDRGSQCTIL